MSDLIAVAYPDKNTAEEVRDRLLRLTAEHVILDAREAAGVAAS